MGRLDELKVFPGLDALKSARAGGTFRAGRFPWITGAFVVLDVGLYLAMRRRGPIDEDALVAWGAKVAPLVWDLGQLWRLLTANLVHENAVHIAFNLFVLFSVGGALERVLRPLDYGLLLVASALGTTAVSLWALPQAVTAGASGIVYGAFGAAVVFGVKHRDVLAERHRRMLGEAMVPTVLAFLYIGFTSSGVDTWAHVGGLAAGAGTAIVLEPRTASGPGGRSIAARLGLIAAPLVAMGVGGSWIAARGPRMEDIADDGLGLQAQVPGTWRKGTARFGQLAFANGLPGLGRASFTVQAMVAPEATLDELAERYVTRALVAQERANEVHELAVTTARPVWVGGMAGKLVEAKFREEGSSTQLRAYLIKRGELSYELVYQWAEAYPAYERVVDRMVASMRMVEPKAVREARARALVDPGAWALAGLGETLYRLGEPNAAVEAFEWAVEARPEDGEAYARLALALLGLGKRDEGCRSAETALGLASDSAMAFEAMGACQLVQGDRDGARRYLERAVEAAPRDERLAEKLRALQ